MAKRVSKKALLLMVLAGVIALAACGKKESFFEEMGGKKVDYKNMTMEVPESVTKASSVGVLTNDCDLGKAYKSNTDEHVFYAQMDSYYLASFHVDRDQYEKDKLADLLNERANVWITAAEDIGKESDLSGMSKQLYSVSAEVVPCRDLFADMTGTVSVLTYHNDVWISAALAIGNEDLTDAIAKSIRVSDLNASKQAYAAAEAAERDVPKKGAVTEIDKWGRVSVMNKSVTGEKTEILGKVTEVYDTADSFGVMQKYADALAESKYSLPEDAEWNVAKIELFWGDINREKYDPYVDVKVGSNQRTYRLAEDGNDLYVFYKAPKKHPYKIKVGNEKGLVVNVY